MQTLVDLTKLSEFLHAPVAMTLASCGNLQRPALTRGIGCRLSPENGHLWLFISRATSADLLNDISKHPQIAVVFCLPSTEQAIQIKGLVTSTRPLTSAELECVESHRLGFNEQISPLGYRSEFTACYLYAEDPVALLLKPLAVYQQTPGPLAGSHFT